MKVSDIYKKNLIVTLPEKATLHEAIQLFVSSHHNNLPVIDDSHRVVGMVSLQDILRLILPEEMTENTVLAEALGTSNLFEDNLRTVRKKHVSEIMQKEFPTVSPETDLLVVAAHMVHHNRYCVFVQENDTVVGLISRTDLRLVLGRMEE